MEVHRKGIKNQHVGDYPPNGKVRVAAPLYLDDVAVRLAIVSRLNWIAGFIRCIADDVLRDRFFVKTV